jgi:hypothetical protein
MSALVSSVPTCPRCGKKDKVDLPGDLGWPPVSDPWCRRCVGYLSYFAAVHRAKRHAPDFDGPEPARGGTVSQPKLSACQEKTLARLVAQYPGWIKVDKIVGMALVRRGLALGKEERYRDEARAHWIFRATQGDKQA